MLGIIPTTYPHSVYKELDKPVRQFDKTLFPHLEQILPENLRSKLGPLGENGRYTSAMTLLWHHANISSSARKADAFSAFEQLQWKGNAHTFSEEYSACINELTESGAGLFD